MATPIQSINLQVINTKTTYNNLNTISIINQVESNLIITNDITSGYVELLEGQTLTITSSTGFVLPTLTLDSDGIINASVITT
jgi:hypothetical protein